MSRLGLSKGVIAIILAAGIIIGLSIWLLYPREISDYFADDFEAGLSNWKIGAEVPEDPNNLGHTVNWTVEHSPSRSSSGSYSVRLAIDGSRTTAQFGLATSLAWSTMHKKPLT